MSNKPTSPETLYGTGRDYLREQIKTNEILADIAGVEYTPPEGVPKGKYMENKWLLDAAEKKNELLEEIAEGGPGGGSAAAKAIGIDYATDGIFLKKQNGDTIQGSGATLPAYGVTFDPATGGLTLTKNGTAMQGQTVTIPNYGSPVGVDASADMTDHDKIYLYLGTTGGGLTNGHFYYWDGAAWADGGEYAAATVQTDKTLLVEDRAADAKATGDAINSVKTQLNEFEDSTFTVTPGKNLYNPAEILDEKYLNSANGKISADSAFDTTDFMPVVPGKYLTLSRKASGIYVAYSVPSYAFYTDYNEDSFIAGSGGTYNTNPIVPENAVYARVCFNNNAEDLQVELTDDGVFTSYEAYHAPVYTLKDTIPLPVEQITGDVASKINNVSVKGSNLIPISENGVGAYVRNGNNITFYESYTTFHYAIINVKKNSRYYMNYGPRWWILTDDNDTVIDGAQYLSPYTKKYIDTGNATKLYYTVEAASWNTGVIISEGLTGVITNIQQTSLLQKLNQLMFDGWYACALPKNLIKFTVGINEKFYTKNILALPEVNDVWLSVGGFSEFEIDGFYIPVTTVGNFNNYLFSVFDENLNLIENSVNGQFGRRYNDNVSDCSALIIGDSTVERSGGKIGQTLIDAFTSRGKTITLLGTRGTGDNKNEGRSGWSAADYVGKSTRGSDTTQNPFYNPTSETFDFSYYMTNQQYSAVDFVVVQLGINDLWSVSINEAKERIETLIEDIFTILNSIKTYNANQKIILNLPTPCTGKTTGTYAMMPVQQKLMRAKFIYYNSLMEVLHTNFSNTYCSHCHLILDPETDIADQIHPTDSGLEKMGMEVLSQINAFQNA